MLSILSPRHSCGFSSIPLERYRRPFGGEIAGRQDRPQVVELDGSSLT